MSGFDIMSAAPGDVVAGDDALGAASSTDNAVARFDGTGGKQLQNSVLIVSDTGAVSGVSTLQTSGNVGIGNAPSGTTGQVLYITTAADVAQLVVLENTNAVGTTASMGVRILNATGNITTRAHGTGVVTSRWGGALSQSVEILANVATGAFLAIGTNGAHEFRLGTAQVARVTIGAAGGVRVDGIGTAITTKTGAYSILVSDGTILGDTSSGGFTLTLPSAASCTGFRFTVKKIAAANTLTVAGTIDGVVNLAMTDINQSRTFQSDGTAYQIVSGYL